MKAEISARDIISGMLITIKLKGAQIATLRLKIGAWLMRIAGMVIGCNIVIEGPSQEFDSFGMPIITDYPPMPKCKPPKSDEQVLTEPIPPEVEDHLETCVSPNCKGC